MSVIIPSISSLREPLALPCGNYMGCETTDTHATPFNASTHNLFETNYMSHGGQLHMTVLLFATQTIHAHSTIICCINRCLDAAAGFPSIVDGIVFIWGTDGGKTTKILFHARGIRKCKI